VGLTTTLETELKANVTGLTVVDKENAKKTDYAKTVVVDLAGTYATEANQLAQYLGGQVATLPTGEVAPDAKLKAGILIIIGKNYSPATPSATTK
jgi:glycerol-3-phosphate dehydrogenase